MLMATGIWREGLHHILWERRYTGDLVDINQVQLAEELCVSKYTVNRVLKRMGEEGRLSSEGEHTYRLIDPDLVTVPDE